jgi:hypothetical protein
MLSKCNSISLNVSLNFIENMSPSIDSPEDIPQTFQAILATIGEKILQNIRTGKFSLADLGTVATILQKLIDCYVELKPFVHDASEEMGQMLSRDTIDAIQTQLNFL